MISDRSFSRPVCSEWLPAERAFFMEDTAPEHAPEKSARHCAAAAKTVVLVAAV